MADLVIGMGKLALSTTTLTEALAVALVICAVGASTAAVVYAFAKYSELDISIELGAGDLVSVLT